MPRPSLISKADYICNQNNRQGKGRKLAEQFDQIKYKNEYNRLNYDRFSLTAPKGRKDEIKVAAKAAGMSLNEFILTAVAEKMGEEK